MTPTETTTILRQFNVWRRGADVPQPKPREIGEAIDAAVEMIERLEAAEKAVTEAYQRGYATGQEEIEKERDNANAAAVGIALQMEKLQAERDALRAKIAEMEKQEPVANPAVINELLDRLEAAEKETASWKGLAKQFGNEADALRAKIEALRELEEREQRDEALLRQVLEVLSRAHQTAMEQTLRARVPECSEFAGIAQDLDFVVAALRERLASGHECAAAVREMKESGND